MAVIDSAPSGQYVAMELRDAGNPGVDGQLARQMVAAARGIEARDERIARMIDSYFDLVWRTLRRLGVLSSGLDDATQQVFIVAAQKLPTIEVAGERAYLMGIAYRVASDARRTRMRRREAAVEVDLDEYAGPDASQEELVDQKRARELLDKVLATMPIDLRAAFTLFEIEEMSCPEIAEALSVPLGTVSSRLRRARELFREQVQLLATLPEGGAHG